MKKFVISLFLLSFSTMMSSFVFSQQSNEPMSSLPQGKWVVEQVSVEKNTDGKIENTVYKSAAEVKSYVPCPQELEISGQTITLYYPGGRKDVAGYIVEGDRLNISTSASVQYYQYGMSGEKLILYATHSYLNNLSNGQTEHIEEKRNLVLKNK